MKGTDLHYRKNKLDAVLKKITEDYVCERKLGKVKICNTRSPKAGKCSKCNSKLKHNPATAPKNREHLLKFYNKAVADGLSVGRIQKLLNILINVSNWLDKDFRDADKDDLIRVVRIIEEKNFKEWTKNDYRIAIKKFYKWLEGDDDIAPKKVRWIRTTIRKKDRKTPEELLTEEDIKNIVDKAEHPRDKAMIFALYESGARISEIGALRLRHIKFDDMGMIIIVDGKTGMRRIRLVSSAPLISAWLNYHGDKENPDAPLWTTHGKNSKNDFLSYNGIADTIKRIAKKAGIKKRIHMHLFRHSRLTHLANHLTEAQLKNFAGWEQSSEMASVYVHMSGRDMDEAVLRANGVEIKKEDKKDQTTLKPTDCMRCKHKNSATSKFCASCGLPVDLKTAIEMGEQRETSDKKLDALLEDKDFKKAMETALRKLIEKR